MSDNSLRGRVTSWIGKSDLRLLSVVVAGVYGILLSLSIIAGFDTISGLAGRFRAITFLIVLYAMAALALNLQWGYGGMLNLGVAGFMAIGLYTMAILSGSPDGRVPGLGLPLPIGVLAGILFTALLGALAALPALRLKADYLAIVTLAFGEIIRLSIRSGTLAEFSIAGRTVGTGGTDSIDLPGSPVDWLLYDATPLGSGIEAVSSATGIRTSTLDGLVYVLLLILILIGFYVLLSRIGNSPFGRVLKAIREDEVAASSLGKDVRVFKIKAFAVGCGLMGLVGILWWLDRGTVSADFFEPELTFFIFVALIIGGAGSNTGSVIGAVLFAGLLFEGPQLIQRIMQSTFDATSPPSTIFGAFESSEAFVGYFFSDVNLSALQLILLGVIIIYLMQRRPEGMLGHRDEIASTINLSERPSAEEEQ